MTQELEDIKTKLYGKTARGFNLTWEPEENTFVITLTSKNKDISYSKKIAKCNWSFFPFTEEQTKVLETKILGSNLDMWICYQKMTEFILWFMRRNMTSIGGMHKFKKDSIFSSDEYDYLEYMKLPNWDLYSKPDNSEYSSSKIEYPLVENQKSSYPYDRFIKISNFGGWIGNFWWVNREPHISFQSEYFIGSFGFDGTPQFILGMDVPKSYHTNLNKT